MAKDKETTQQPKGAVHGRAGLSQDEAAAHEHAQESPQDRAERDAAERRKAADAQTELAKQDPGMRGEPRGSLTEVDKAKREERGDR